MNTTNNFKLAVTAVRASKWRSFLTVLGIIVGVVSVVTIVSLGEGVKKEVTGQINHLGSDLLTVQPGKTVTRDAEGRVKDINLLATFGGAGSLSENDLKVVQQTKDVRVAVPLGIVSGVASTDGRDFDRGFILGTTDALPTILNQKVEYGAFFTEKDADDTVAVIGKKVAEELFRENVPIGQSVKIRGQNFVVRGIFEEFDNSPLAPNSDYNYAIFIPFAIAKEISGGQAQIQEILVKPTDVSRTETAATGLTAGLRQAHGGQEDFTILRQSDNLAIADRVLTLLTGLISGIAAISLIVGGIGIMNIMLVAVSERTHEIGVRKAIGATNRQILNQFMIESAVLSFVGGLIGVILSWVTNYFLRVFTNLQPVITWQVVVVAVGMALAVGVIFGVAPALKAVRKDPIESLRYGQ